MCLLWTPIKSIFRIDLMHWRHVSITTTPCWGSRLVALRTHVVLAVRISPSVNARPGPARPARRYGMQGLTPLAACLAMAHVAVLRLTPNTRGRPSVTSYICIYGLCIYTNFYCQYLLSSYAVMACALFGVLANCINWGYLVIDVGLKNESHI